MGKATGRRYRYVAGQFNRMAVCSICDQDATQTRMSFCCIDLIGDVDFRCAACRGVSADAVNSSPFSPTRKALSSTDARDTLVQSRNRRDMASRVLPAFADIQTQRQSGERK